MSQNSFVESWRLTDYGSNTLPPKAGATESNLVGNSPGPMGPEELFSYLFFFAPFRDMKMAPKRYWR